LIEEIVWCVIADDDETDIRSVSFVLITLRKQLSLCFFVLVYLTSIFHSRRYAEFWQDVGLKDNPNHDNRNNPPVIHFGIPFFSLFTQRAILCPFAGKSPTACASESSRGSRPR
jgi:hypothetical protein